MIIDVSLEESTDGILFELNQGRQVANAQKLSDFSFIRKISFKHGDRNGTFE